MSRTIINALMVVALATSSLCAQDEATPDSRPSLDSNAVLGKVVSTTTATFTLDDWLRIKRVRDRMLVGRRIVNPATLETEWSVPDRFRCRPTCDDCAEPYICASGVSADEPSSPELIVYDRHGIVVQHRVGPPLPNRIMYHLDVRSSPHGNYFVPPSYALGPYAHTVTGRSGDALLNGNLLNEQWWKNECYPFNDSIAAWECPDYSGDNWYCDPLALCFVNVFTREVIKRVELDQRIMVEKSLNPPQGSGLLLLEEEDGMVCYIGPQMEYLWHYSRSHRARLTAFAEHGQFIVLDVVTKDDDGNLWMELVNLATLNGEEVWRARIGGRCSDGVETSSESYLAGDIVRYEWCEVTHLIRFDEDTGAITARDSLPTVAHLFKTDDGFVTIERRIEDSTMWVSKLWSGKSE